jgi:3-hydroxyisobutyrate dehydrogenase
MAHGGTSAERSARTAEAVAVLGAGGPRVQPVFDAIGHRTIRAGEAGAGTRLKLVTNSWVLSVVEADAETIALAEGLGIDPALFFQAIEGGPLDLPYLKMKARAMLERDFTPSFRLRLAAKDAALWATRPGSTAWTCPCSSCWRPGSAQP